MPDPSHAERLRAEHGEVNTALVNLAALLENAANEVRAQGVVRPLPELSRARDRLLTLWRATADAARTLGVESDGMGELDVSLHSIDVSISQIEEVERTRTRRLHRNSTALARLDLAARLQASTPMAVAGLESIKASAKDLAAQISSDPEHPAIDEILEGRNGLVEFVDLVEEIQRVQDAGQTALEANSRLDDLDARVVASQGRHIARLAMLVTLPRDGTPQEVGTSAEPRSAMAEATPRTNASTAASPAEDPTKPTSEPSTAPSPSSRPSPIPEPASQCPADMRVVSTTAPSAAGMAGSSAPPSPPFAATSSAMPVGPVPEPRPASTPSVVALPSPSEPTTAKGVATSIQAQVDPAALSSTSASAAITPYSQASVRSSVTFTNLSQPLAMPGPLRRSASPSEVRAPTDASAKAPHPASTPGPRPKARPQVPLLDPPSREPLPQDIPVFSPDLTKGRLPELPESLERLLDDHLAQGRVVEAAAFAEKLREVAGPGAAPSPALLLAFVGHDAALPRSATEECEIWLTGLAEDPDERSTLPIALLWAVAGVLWLGQTVSRLDHLRRLVQAAFAGDDAVRDLLDDLFVRGAKGQEPGALVLASRADPARTEPGAEELRQQLHDQFLRARNAPYANGDCRRAWKRIDSERIEPVRAAVARRAPAGELRRVASGLDLSRLLKTLGVEGTYRVGMISRAQEIEALVMKLANAQESAPARGPQRHVDARLRELLEAARRHEQWGRLVTWALEPDRARAAEFSR